MVFIVMVKFMLFVIFIMWFENCVENKESDGIWLLIVYRVWSVLIELFWIVVFCMNLINIYWLLDL